MDVFVAGEFIEAVTEVDCRAKELTDPINQGLVNVARPRTVHVLGHGHFWLKLILA